MVEILDFPKTEEFSPQDKVTRAVASLKEEGVLDGSAYSAVELLEIFGAFDHGLLDLLPPVDIPLILGRRIIKSVVERLSS